MPADPWAEFEEVAPARAAPAAMSAGGAPRPILSLPNVGEARDDARADAQLGISMASENRQAGTQAAQLDLDRQKFEYQQQQDARKAKGVATDPNRALQLRTILENISRVRDMSKENFAVGRLSRSVSDLPLVGPWLGQNRSDVEGALEMIEGDLIQQQIARLSQLNGGNGVASLANSVSEARRMAASVANLNPDQSLEEFQIGLDRAEQFYKTQLAQVEGQDATRTPEMRGGVPVGTQVAFGADTAAQGGFDRNAALMEKHGVDANQEAAIQAFWNANRGNAGLTPQGVAQFYQSIGAGVPPVEDITRGIEGAKSGAMFSGFDLSGEEAAYNQRLADEAAKRARKEGEPGAGDLLRQGFMAGLGDEAAGIASAITGDGYQFGNDLRDYQLEQARKNAGGIGTAAELLGGVASLGGNVLASPASLRAAVGQGAAAGAVPGFGYGEGAAGSAVGAGLGAAGGAALGRFFAPRGARPGAGGGGGGSEVIQAADSLNQQYGSNIRPIAADVGGTAVRRASGATAQLPLGAAPIINASRAVETESAGALRSIAESVGSPAELEAAGNAALSGARSWMNSSRNRVNLLYTKAKNLSGDTRLPLTNAIQALDQNVAELGDTPGGTSSLGFFQNLRDKIAGEYTPEGIRRMRTEVRNDLVKDGLRFSDTERRAMMVVDAAEDDIMQGLASAGKTDAAQAWRDASAAARERMTVIDEAIAPVIGKRGDAPRSGEQIMGAINQMTKANNARLGQFMNNLPPDEAGTVRSTIISRLGTNDADASNFTLAKFLTQWGKMTPGSKRTLFGGELTEALDKLSTVAQGTGQAQRFVNNSNTGSVVGLGMTGASLAGDPVTAVVGMAAQYGAGKLLANPRFARWLAKMPKEPGAQQAHVRNLSKISAADSAIANEVSALQAQIIQLFPQGVQTGPARLAAQDGDQERTEGARR